KLDAQIAEIGGEVVKRGPGRPPKVGGRKAGRPPGRRRPKNKMSLADFLGKVLKKEPMDLPQIIEAVKKAGYKSSSKQFANVIGQRLNKDKRFKRVGRGQY